MHARNFWGGAMKRFRLSTLMLLIVIVALGTALMVQHHRAARREAELQARLAEANAVVAEHYALGILHMEGDTVMVKPKKKDEGSGW
jgi:hypothetical protein